MYAQPYVRHLSGHPRHHRIGGQPSTNNIRNRDHVLAPSLIGMPPTSALQYMPMAAGGLWTPLPAGQGSLVASQSSSTFSHGHQHIPSSNIPRAYLWNYTSTPQLVDYAENQVPVPPADAPQIYPHLSTPSQLLGYAGNQAPVTPFDAPQGHSQSYTPSQILGHAEDQVPMPLLGAPQESSYLPCHVPEVYTPSLRPLGCAGGQVPMPPACAPPSDFRLSTPSSRLLSGGEDQVPISPLVAPQESSQLPFPIGQSIGSSASACGHSFQNQESVRTDSLPLPPGNERVTKRKRKVSLSAENDGKRQNPAVLVRKVLSTEKSTSRKPKKADYNPQQCTYCFGWITRPRRFRNHVRDTCVKDLIVKHKISEKEVGRLIKQWGIPKLILLSSIDIAIIKSLNDKELKACITELRSRLEKLIRETPDEEVVEVLITWGASASMLRNTHETDTNGKTTSQASHTQSVKDAEANGSKMATENPIMMSSESRTPTPCLSDTRETSSNFSFHSYDFKVSPPTDPVDIPSSGTEVQASLDRAIQFLFGQGNTASFSFGQNETYPDLTSDVIPQPQSESGTVGWPFDPIPSFTDLYEPFPCAPNDIDFSTLF